ncbi:MAG: aminoacyl-tRNA hydrolase [Chloroflexi bacterium]|nr:aminoacyl-tRNA hydrolase [Chloroflexota bacterium]
MIRITPLLSVDERELTFDFVRASGPGGQNVNKVATAVQLRFDIARSGSLSAEVKARLLKIAGQRVTTDGILVIEAKRHRTQEQNREDAIQRFSELVRKASAKPKPRRKTKPTAASREKRLQIKKRRGEIKRTRSNVHESD